MQDETGFSTGDEQQQVREERQWLADRLVKLGKYLETHVEHNDDRRLMVEQERAMEDYLKTLDIRISRFSKAAAPAPEAPVEGEPEQNRAPEGE